MLPTGVWLRVNEPITIGNHSEPMATVPLIQVRRMCSLSSKSPIPAPHSTHR
jgi:hypothetical protein